MNNYEQQVEIGKEIIRMQLVRIANGLNAPHLLGLEFMLTDRDFDCDRVSLVDSQGLKIVMKVERDDLADIGAHKAVRRRITRPLATAVRSYLAA